MEVTYYPSDPAAGRSPVAAGLKKVGRKHSELLALFRSTMESIEAHGVNHLRETKPKWVKPLKHLDEPLWELRIPPKRRGGVLRAYYFQISDDEICILDVQLKKSDDKAETGAAEARYHEMMRDRQ